MRALFAIVKKELLDALRDGKSLSTAFLMPVILAAVSFGTMQFMASQRQAQSDIELAVAGADRIAPLIDTLREQGIKIIPAPEDPEEAIRQQRLQMALIVPDDFTTKFRAQQSTTLYLLSDHSRTDTSMRVTRIQNFIQQWSLHTGALRLMTRNISPEIIQPINVRNVNVTSDQRLASKILAGLPMFLLMIAFSSGLGMIADMASGERERRSLEPLMANPVSNTQIFLGKWLSAFIVTWCLCCIGIALQFISIRLAPTAELGLRLNIDAALFVMVLTLVTPVICFAVSLQLLVSFFAKSFKDAQSYNSLIIFLPMLPGLYLSFNSSTAALWQMWVPMLGPAALLVDAIAGDAINPWYTLITALVNAIGALLFAFAGVRLLQREKTVFG